MHHYLIQMINSEFESAAEGAYESLEAALEAGVRSASELARDLIARGEEHFAIEIRIVEGGRMIARRVLAYSISSLAVVV